MKKQKPEEKLCYNEINALIKLDIRTSLKACEEEWARARAPYKAYWREMLAEYKLRKAENKRK